MSDPSLTKGRVSRQQALRSGAAAIGGGAALLAGAPAPAVLTGTQTGRTFRGLVRHAMTLDVQDLRLLSIDPRQVVVRSQAVQDTADRTIITGVVEF